MQMVPFSALLRRETAALILTECWSIYKYKDRKCATNKRHYRIFLLKPWPLNAWDKNLTFSSSVFEPLDVRVVFHQDLHHLLLRGHSQVSAVTKLSNKMSRVKLAGIQKEAGSNLGRALNSKLNPKNLVILAEKQQKFLQNLVKLPRKTWRVINNTRCGCKQTIQAPFQSLTADKQ